MEFDISISQTLALQQSSTSLQHQTTKLLDSGFFRSMERLLKIMAVNQRVVV
jgi:hypothetical protein